MKFKPLALLVACGALLVSCGTTEPSSAASSKASSTTSAEFKPQYLDFVEKGKLRIDLFDVDVNFSYGNDALSKSVNTVTIAKDSFAVPNKDSELVYRIVMFAESETGYSPKVLSRAEGSLEEFFSLGSITKFFNNYVGEGRGYAAISTGDAYQWSKGLNAKLDAEITSCIPTSL